MKERPILFSHSMVRAILEGKKSQTRRAIKLPAAPMRLGEWEPTTVGGEGCFTFGKNREKISVPEQTAIWHTRNGKTLVCPYGEVGNRLWVRETFKPISGGYAFKADNHVNWCKSVRETKWRPSIHMPRRASRIDLEITGVRIERLGDISRDDAIAEGAPRPDAAYSMRDSYRMLWEAINGKGSWDLNPWVWVIEFTRVKP